MLYLDEFGNIVQKNMDGGDTAARTGFLESVLQFRKLLGISNDEFLNSTAWRFQNQWPTLITPNCQLIRSPRPGDSTPPWNDPTDTSRDQTTPMIIAFGLNGMKKQVEWIQPKGFILRKYQNADVASPENINQVRRALGQTPTWLGDVWAHGGTLVRISQAAKDPDDVGDDLNCFISLCHAFLVSPTSWSRYSLKYYLRHRPLSNGHYKLGKADNVYGALAWYFREETGANPILAELCLPLIQRLKGIFDMPQVT